MDTRTGQFVNLNEEEAQKAEKEWLAWKAGLLEEMPQYAPVDGDKVPVIARAKRKKKRTKATRSYRDYCNG